MISMYILWTYDQMYFHFFQMEFLTKFHPYLPEIEIFLKF